MEKEKIEIGINLRVTENADKGMRLYMEDVALYYFEKCPDKPDADKIKFAYFAVFDGHGGSEAALFAKAYLLDEIKKIDGFWGTDDRLILDAIKIGFRNTHKKMWEERARWPKTASGFDSTAGTTASIAVIRNRKLYIGHVGDSAIVLGYRDPLEPHRDVWKPHLLTVEHKPSNPAERQRIQKAGGNLKRKAGVDRVVWWRPTQPPTPGSSSGDGRALCNSSQQVGNDAGKFECIPFLAVARSLGDLWSYDSYTNEYHVSPEPDVHCLPLDPESHKCIILGSDGLWNMLTPDAAVDFVRICERYTELKVFTDPEVSHNFFYNPSGSLVKLALSKWQQRKLRADNVTAMVVMLDPPGKPMSMIRAEQRRRTFDNMGFSTVPEQDRLPLTHFLMPCEKWQNANRPVPQLATSSSVAAAAPQFSPMHKPPAPAFYNNNTGNTPNGSSSSSQNQTSSSRKRAVAKPSLRRSGGVKTEPATPPLPVSPTTSAKSFSRIPLRRSGGATTRSESVPITGAAKPLTRVRSLNTSSSSPDIDQSELVTGNPTPSSLPTNQPVNKRKRRSLCEPSTSAAAITTVSEPTVTSGRQLRSRRTVQ